MVDKRQFRADLFYRLSVFPIELPPLRERHEDIRLLVRHFAMEYADRVRKPIKAISEEFMAGLVRYPRPGNIRELQNFVERSLILSTGPVLNGSLSELSCTTQEAALVAPVTLEQAESVRTSCRLSSKRRVCWAAGMALPPDWACRGRP